MSEKIKFKISDFRIGMEVETPIGMGKIYLIEQSENIKVKIEVPPNYCLTKQLYPFSKLKPVLRTLDTMTDEEAIEIKEICQWNVNCKDCWIEHYHTNLELNKTIKFTNYLEKQGFTFAGYSANELIKKGLAVKK